MTSTETSQQLIHWFSTQQLHTEVILKHLTWKDAVRLAASCPQLWQEVERMVAMAKPDTVAALNNKTPDRLRIPLLTGLTRDQVRAEDNYVLRWACRRGHLAVAQWLTERFQLTADDVRVNDNEALRWACRRGHLAVAQWLTERFQLTADDARAEDNWALLWTCHNGHLPVVQWLTERFQLTADEIGRAHV